MEQRNRKLQGLVLLPTKFCDDGQILLLNGVAVVLKICDAEVRS